MQSESQEVLGYKKIQIQQLQPRQQIKSKPTQNKDLISKIGSERKWQGKPIICYDDSGISQERKIQQSRFFRVSHFFNAFSHAYTQHGDIILIPDQIWIMICFYLSKYIDENAKKLRDKLVKHEGIKNITIVQYAETEQQSLQMQKNWDYFFEEVIKQIDKNSKNGIINTFACDFSTTNKTYKVISTALIMNSMKKFFKFSRRMGKACGINNVYMAGQRQDWENMIEKLNKMIKFDVDGMLKTYVKHMTVILQKFLQTYDEMPDVEWWNTIMTTPEKRKKYMNEEMEVEGWILHFFGIYQKQVLTGFPQMKIQVPIFLVNEWTKKQKQLLLVADWVSVSKFNERTYKPDVAMMIFELSQKNLTEAEIRQRKLVENKIQQA